jgi:hypothetical protein
MAGKSSLLAVSVLCLLLPALVLSAHAEQIGRMEDATLAFQDTTAIAKKTLPEYLLQDAAVPPGGRARAGANMQLRVGHLQSGGISCGEIFAPHRRHLRSTWIQRSICIPS